jgi:hypothetical protein
MQFAASIIAFLLLGMWLDRRLGTAPWLLIAGAALGGVGGFWAMYRNLVVAPRERDAALQQGRPSVNRQGLRYTVIALLIAAAIAAAGVALGGPAHRAGVLAGSALGFVTQAAVFWIFFIRLYPGKDQAWTAYGLGLLVRLAVFAVTAFVLAPRAGLPFAATLFSMVSVFWLTTLSEAAYLKNRTSNPTQA